jgi:HD-GYP domain-containing protein (c-di-GMP phosphodiesterase class II)
MPAGRSIKTKILGIILLSVFLITTILGIMTFEFSKARLVAMLGGSIKSIASTIASFIDPEDLSLIMSKSEKINERRLATSSAVYSHVYGKQVEMGEIAPDPGLEKAINAYLKYTKLLADIKRSNKIDSPLNVYIVDNNRLRHVLTSDPVILTGAFYTMRPEAKEAFSTGMPQCTRIYKDKDGTWISAYATIPGSSIGMIEINYKINSYLAMLNRELWIIILICFIGFFAAAFISYKLVAPLVSDIQALDEAVFELEEGRYHTPIKTMSDDEIGHLANTFETLRLSIRSKIDELKLSLAREKRAHMESIIALTNAIETRDPYTKEHLSRVERYALLIAKEMHLTREEMTNLMYSCFLHDIGKIYIDTALLQKPKLTTEEFAEIKKHSENGAKIIEGIQFLEGVREAVLYHQERYDGKGYPAGLKGKDIPLLARIIAVADAFDAMTTDRPYKPKISYAAAMDEIAKCAGTQFDPDICQFFLKYRYHIESIAKKHFERSDEDLA